MKSQLQCLTFEINAFNSACSFTAFPNAAFSSWTREKLSNSRNSTCWHSTWRRSATFRYNFDSFRNENYKHKSAPAAGYRSFGCSQRMARGFREPKLKYFAALKCLFQVYFGQNPSTNESRCFLTMQITTWEKNFTFQSIFSTVLTCYFSLNQD